MINTMKMQRQKFLIDLLGKRKISEIDNYDELENKFIEKFGCGFSLMLKNEEVYCSKQTCYLTYDISGSVQRTILKERQLDTAHKKNVWYYSIKDKKYYASSNLEIENSVIREHWGHIGEFESFEDFFAYKRVIQKLDKKLSNEDDEAIDIGSHKVVAIDLFINKCLEDQAMYPNITIKEFKIFEKMYNGGLIYSHDENIKGMQSFDINSAYLYILSRFGTFPICKPTIMTTEEVLKEIDIKATFGLYKLEVQKEDLDRRYCVYSNNGYYTQIDIIAMEEANVKYNLKENGKHYIYEHVKDFSNDIRKLVDPLYELKKQDKYKKHAKEMLVKLWGGLCQRMSKSVQLNKFDCNEHLFVKKTTDDKVVYFTGEFEYYFGRMKPFLLSMARYRTGKTIRKILETGYKVVRVYTDSFVSNIPTSEFKKIAQMGDDIGAYKIEKTFENDDRYIHANMLESKKKEIETIKEEKRIILQKEKQTKAVRRKPRNTVSIENSFAMFNDIEGEEIEIEF